MKLSKLILTAAVVFLTAAPSASALSISASIESKVTVNINATTTPAPVVKNYTGIIVDCRGLGLQRAMSPVIKNSSGKIVYGDKNLDPDRIAEFGMASYATSMREVERAGANPLTVKAVGVSDFKCNPVISVGDANKIILANSDAHFLEDANVVFLTD